MAELCVVHLARHANGWEPFERFMRSYEEHPAGIDHDLVTLFKGFPDHVIPPEYLERLAPHGGKFLVLDDVGFDIGAYWAAARLLPCESFCFLNSFSVILDTGWLAKMAQHHRPSVGLVGASGSWESHHSGRDERVRAGLLLAPWRVAPPPFPPRRLTARDRLWLIKEWLRIRDDSPPFPNPHIRTNAFLIRRDLVLDIDVGELSTKTDALRFESGRRSLTQQVLTRGLEVLVVGRDGLPYPVDDWPKSGTFRSGDQTNLMVSDNRTEEWAATPSPFKEQQAADAWGPRKPWGPIRLPRRPRLSSSRRP